MRIILFFLAAVLISGCQQALIENNEASGIQIDESFEVEEYMAADLQEWDFYGIGHTGLAYNQLILSETEGSKGVILVSPETYGENQIVSYDVMALTPATVLVAMLSCNNTDSPGLEFDAGYDGNIAYLFESVSFYMIAFHDAPHNRFPFVNKFPNEGNNPLQEADKTYMRPGQYYHIDISRQGNKISLYIDDQKVLDTIDEHSIPGGKFVFRIRGTGHHAASCLIRNLKIYSKD